MRVIRMCLGGPWVGARKAPVYEEHSMGSQCEEPDGGLRYSQGVRVIAR